MACIMAAFTGFILYKMLPLGAFAMGATAGGFIGFTLFGLMFSTTKMSVLFIIIVVLCSAAMGILSFKYY